MSQPLVVTSTITVPATDLRWTAARASGPGGQNVNKVSSKVELRFDLQGSRALDEDTKQRLALAAASRIDAQGALLVVSQLTRDQSRNLEDAREKLREMIVAALTRPKKRRPTRPSRSANQRRLTQKQRKGEVKQQRRARDE